MRICVTEAVAGASDYLVKQTNSVSEVRQEYALNLSISLSAGSKITMIASVAASEAARAQDENSCPLDLKNCNLQDDR